jgi:DNA gyrase subunit A
MAKKNIKPVSKNTLPDAYIEGAGIVVNEKITETLEKNYMPYAMSVIISRALPEIDGFKPSHRKLLYTMYKMGLLTGAKTKSANVVGQTMRLNPHGDAAIYETMVRLSRGNETLLHPYIDSKGNFGKAYSRDMSYAASRYTEVKLDPICNELFRDIDKDTVDFVPNYDNTMTEPSLFPATFPSVLVNANVGIAVSMASSVCPFNLSEVCDTCIEIIKNPQHDIISTLKGPDFPGGGFMLYDEEELKKIYRTGRGSIKIRSKYNYDKSANCIEITEIPYSTTVEAIMDKIIELIKQNKINEISYIRDETDLSGLKLAIDLKRGIDPDRLMQKLYRLTPLQDNYSCNFNILINGMPKVMGVSEIFAEWISFRENCIKRRVKFDLVRKSEKLHLLKGLERILLDIDKAVDIIRKTEEEADVVPNLMKGFEIDEIQAEYVADIKLRNINKEYILRRISETADLEKDIEEMKLILDDDKKIRKIIISELKEVSKKYHKDRRTVILENTEDSYVETEPEIPDYPVNIFLTQSGYFKKITPQSLRMSSEHKLKENDLICTHIETTNRTDLLFFTNQHQVYKSKASAFDNTKASVMGDFIPAKLAFDENESVISIIATCDYEGFLLFVYKNGKIAKVALKSYQTKTNRKKLANAYCSKQELLNIFHIKGNEDILLRTSNNKALLVNCTMISEKSTRDTLGIQVMKLKSKAVLSDVYIADEKMLSETEKFRANSIPASGNSAKNLTDYNQLTF